MISNKSSDRYYVKNALILLLTVPILFLAVSCKTDMKQAEKANQQTLFSDESHSKIMSLFLQNARYPEVAKNEGITGRFFIIVKMEAGGKIVKVYVNDKDKSINVTLASLTEVQVVAIKPSTLSNANNPPEFVTDKLTILENEGLRVAKMLETLNLPEWQDKSMEFAISFNFMLTN